MGFQLSEINELSKAAEMLQEASEIWRVDLDDSFQKIEEGMLQRALILNNQASLSIRAGRWQEAMGQVRSALQLQPDLWPAWINSAEILLKTQNTAAAMRSLENALLLEPKQQYAWFLKILLLALVGDSEAAANCLAEAIELLPESSLLAKLTNSSPEELERAITFLTQNVGFPESQTSPPKSLHDFLDCLTATGLFMGATQQEKEILIGQMLELSIDIISENVEAPLCDKILKAKDGDPEILFSILDQSVLENQGLLQILTHAFSQNIAYFDYDLNYRRFSDRFPARVNDPAALVTIDDMTYALLEHKSLQKLSPEQHFATISYVGQTFGKLLMKTALEYCTDEQKKQLETTIQSAPEAIFEIINKFDIPDFEEAVGDSLNHWFEKINHELNNLTEAALPSWLTVPDHGEDEEIDNPLIEAAMGHPSFWNLSPAEQKQIIDQLEDRHGQLVFLVVTKYATEAQRQELLAAMKTTPEQLPEIVGRVSADVAAKVPGFLDKLHQATADEVVRLNDFLWEKVGGHEAVEAEQAHLKEFLREERGKDIPSKTN